jgi:flagellar hook assembly protein FlgD
VEDVNDVKTGLIKSRRIIFTPAVDLKEELASTAIVITCYDSNGNEVKRVTSKDAGDVEDTEDDNNTGNDNTGNGNDNQGQSGNGDSNNGGDEGPAGGEDEGPAGGEG